MSGLGATPAEVGALLDAITEAEAEGYSAYGADDQAAQWAASLSDAEFAEIEAEYLADQHLDGPQLAGAGSGNVIDLADQMSAIDMLLAAQTDREATRRREDAAGQGKRRPSTEVRLMAGLSRAQAGTLTYGGTPATDLANDPDIDGLFSAGARADRGRGCRPDALRTRRRRKTAGTGPALPPVADLAPKSGSAMKAEIMADGDELTRHAGRG